MLVQVVDIRCLVSGVNSIVSPYSPLHSTGKQQLTRLEVKSGRRQTNKLDQTTHTEHMDPRPRPMGMV